MNPEGMEVFFAIGQDFSYGGTRNLTEFLKVFGSKVGQVVSLEVTPEVFDRIEFGSIGGELLDENLAIEGGDVGFDRFAPVSPKTIPDDE